MKKIKKLIKFIKKYEIEKILYLILIIFLFLSGFLQWLKLQEANMLYLFDVTYVINDFIVNIIKNLFAILLSLIIFIVIIYCFIDKINSSKNKLIKDTYTTIMILILLTIIWNCNNYFYPNKNKEVIIWDNKYELYYKNNNYIIINLWNWEYEAIDLKFNKKEIKYLTKKQP